MTRRILWLLLFLVSATSSEAALISRVTTWVDAQVLTHSALNGEFDNLLNDYNGSISAANLAADSVGSSELIEAADYTMQNVTLSGTGPDMRLSPTSGDTLHFGAEYAAATGTIGLISNVTDSKHYIVFRNDHLFEFPQYVSCKTGLTTGADGRVLCNTASWDIGGANAETTCRSAGDFTVASATLTDITGATHTITTAGESRVVISFIGVGASSVAGDDVHLAFTVDGAVVPGPDGLFFDVSDANGRSNVSMAYMTAVLLPGSHTFKAQASRDGTGTFTIDGDSGTQYCFSVQEVKD